MAPRKKEIFETPNRRLRRRRRIIRRCILLFILAVVFAAGIFYFFRIPAFQISDFEVIGAEKIDKGAITRDAREQGEGYVAYFIPRTFFLVYPRSETEAMLLADYKEVRSAKVKLKGLGTVEIRIVERAPRAFYCTQLCYVADEDGLVYESAASTTGKVSFRDVRASAASSSPIGTYPLSTEIFREVATFAERLSELSLHLEEIIIEEDADISVITEEGRLAVSVRESLDEQYEFLKTALSQKTFLYPDGAIRSFNYIDLRFGKKIFYKIEGSSSATSTSSPADI